MSYHHRDKRDDDTRYDDDDSIVARKRNKLDHTPQEAVTDTSQLDDTNTKETTTNSTDIDISRMCGATEEVDPIESTRMSSNESTRMSSIESTRMSSNESASQSYLEWSTFKTFILEEEEDEGKNGQVSIISRLTNLILSASFDMKKIMLENTSNNVAVDETVVMRAVSSMKSIRDLTLTLCCVHKAVGLNDLKQLSHTFSDEVNDVWGYTKKLALEPANVDAYSQTLKHKFLRLLELVGALSLAAVDHIVTGEGRLYIEEKFRGELSVYFMKHQNRFLSSMLDDASMTVEKGIEEMKKYQLSSDHEMSEDVVDSVMNVLTSLATLFQQCAKLLLVYLRSVQHGTNTNHLYADECFHLRSMLTDVSDYKENISLIVTQSKSVAKNCDALEQFLDVPVILADITKSICSSAGDLVAYITAKKTLDEHLAEALYESLEKFVFSGKTVRVGVSILVQEIEKELNVAEEQSIIQHINDDTTVAKRRSLCPLTKSDRRWSNVPSEQYVIRYMDLSSVSEN